MSLISLRNAKFAKFSPINLELLVDQRWAITGPQQGQLLDILGGAGTPSDPKSRKYIWGKEFWPSKVIQKVDFGQGAQANAPYIAARFESFRDEFDYSLRESLQHTAEPDIVEQTLEILHLQDIADRWIVGLSNGQSRRAQLAQALVRQPKLLLVNDPFLGVDPQNKALLSDLLQGLGIPVIIGVSTPDLPEWITNVAIARDNTVKSGNRGEFQSLFTPQTYKKRSAKLGENVISLRNFECRIKSSPIFQGLDLQLHKGERLHLKGPNGSGKSTLLAILTADHPQGWSEAVNTFGKPRQVGVDSYAGINRQIGHTSPEIHAIFPKRLLTSEAIATGFNGDYWKNKALSTEQKSAVANWQSKIGVTEKPFGELNKTEQKLVLLARALVKDPQLLLLDEAFSTFDDDALALGNKILDEYDGAVIVVGHNPREIPACDSELDMSNYITN